MASSMTSVVEGPVLAVTRRSGTSKAGNPYDVTEVRVLVGNRGLAEFSIPSDSRDVPAQGDLISVLVDTEVYGPNLSSRFAGHNPDALASK